MSEMPAELARLADEVRSFGFEYLPASTDDPEDQTRALEMFLYLLEEMPTLYEEMMQQGEVTRPPSRAEQHAIGNYLLKVILAGDCQGTDDELRDLVLHIVPGIRAA
jgi:hypothetical protein